MAGSVVGYDGRSMGAADTGARPTSARGHDRARMAGLGGLTALLAQGLILGMLLVSIPPTTRYLGQEICGVWVTISSLFALLPVIGLGA